MPKLTGIEGIIGSTSQPQPGGKPSIHQPNPPTGSTINHGLTAHSFVLSPGWSSTGGRTLQPWGGEYAAHGPGAFRHSAAALHRLAGAEAALTELYEFEEALAQYHLYHPTRAELLLVDERTLALANNPAEQRLFRQRVEGGRPDEVREYVLAT
jgi:hypothetical protein